MKSLAARFWWGQKQRERKIHWIAWKKLCVTKDFGGLGFRDIKLFNDSLLGKQAWRLCTDTNSLMVRTLKGRYFPHVSFMESNLGNNPSYTWRSIWGVRHVLECGIRRRVGCGSSTLVWKDLWIPGTQSRKVLTPRRDDDANMKVAELINPNTNKWDVGKVRSIFLSFEQDRILSIPISARKPPDTWCWDLEKDGTYSVRSAYKALANSELDVNVASSSGKDKWLWRNIWQGKVLPRIKVFFWQLCSEALPTRKKLWGRIKLGSDVCSVCEANVEDELHIMRTCRVTKGVWEQLGIDGVVENEVRSIREWVELVWNNVGRDEWVRFMTTCWAIWEMRNSIIFNEGQKGPETVKERVMDLVAEMERPHNSVLERGKAGAVSISHVWTPPPIEVVKLNTDAGVIDGVGSCFGVVFRDSSGTVKRCVVEQQQEIWEVRYAEANAIKIGLEEAKEAGYNQVVVETDCKELVDALLKQSEGRSTFHLILEDIRSLCISFNSVVWSFIGRNGNNVAHAMAHMHPWENGRRSWVSDIPHFVTSFAVIDMSVMES